jgi:tetratricopeptide (TPR) repeat protein
MKKLYILLTFLLFGTFGILHSQENESIVIQQDKENDTGYIFAFTEATKMFLFGDYAGAASLYTECLKYNPSSAAAYYQLAEIYLKAGEVSRAKQFSLKAFALDEGNKWYTLQIGNIYQSLQMNDSAIFMYKRLLNGSLRDIGIYYQIAALLEGGKKYEEALIYLYKIEKEVGETRETLVSKSRIYESQGKHKEALNQLRLAITGQDDDYIIYGMMAEHFKMHNQNDSADYYYKKIYGDHTNDANVVFSYGEFLLSTGQLHEAEHVYVSLYDNSGVDENIKIRYVYNALQDQDFFKKVRPVLDTIVKVLLNSSPEKLNILSLYSDVNYRLGNYKISSLILRKIIVKDKENYKAWEQLLFCESALENKDSVIYFGMMAIKEFSNRPLPYLIVSSVYYTEEKYKEALVLLNAGEPFADTETIQLEYYSLLAECYSKVGNYELSDKYYENALNVDSLNYGVLNNFAYSLAVREEYLERAKAMSWITVENEGENATFLDTYAWVLYKSKQVDEALKYIKKAIKNEGNKNPEIMDHYGEILLKKGRKQKAVRVWTEAMILGDEDFKIKLRQKISENDT